jgi:hypothetical protein
MDTYVRWTPGESWPSTHRWSQCLHDARNSYAQYVPIGYRLFGRYLDKAYNSVPGGVGSNPPRGTSVHPRTASSTAMADNSTTSKLPTTHQPPTDYTHSPAINGTHRHEHNTGEHSIYLSNPTSRSVAKETRSVARTNSEATMHISIEPRQTLEQVGSQGPHVFQPRPRSGEPPRDFPFSPMSTYMAGKTIVSDTF